MSNQLSKEDLEFFRRCGSKGGKIGGAKNKAKGREYFVKISKMRKKKLSTSDVDEPIV